ncbi:penicillin-binding protein 2 [Clostridium saudiense]|nr:penicillin-binding protein 2 [Clostridium saudiense]
MNDLGKSVRHVMTIFLFCFIALISYIAYFQVFKGPDIANDSGNVRLWAKRNEILRGTIYDRNGAELATSERIDETTQQRNYLYGNLFVHPLGYIDQTYGLSGLEETYDDELSSYSTFRNGINDFLDTALQQVAYDALGDNKGSVVAINPKTGEILAMVSKPTFNPNDLDVEMEKANAGSGDDTPLINRAIDGVYPPGSVFKTVTLSSALENISGVAERQFDDEGKITFDDGTELNNFAYEVHGIIDLRRAYRVSSNVVFGTLAMELGNEKLKDTAESFGFNSVIRGEGFTATASQFPTLQDYEKGNIAQSGIGQGAVLSTPMQMAMVTAAVANDGVLMKPKLVNSIVDKNGNVVRNISSEEIRQAIPSDVAATVKDYMKYLVDNNIYRWPAFEGTNAGGKTGTADYNLPDGTEAVPHGWFIAAAPMDDPEIAVAVIVENGESGAGSAAIIASQVVRQAVLGY